MQDDSDEWEVLNSSSSSSTDSNEDEWQEISSNQETPIPTKVNSVNADLSSSSQNLNDAFMWATFGSVTYRFPRRFVRSNGQTYSLIEAGESITIYAADGTVEDTMEIPSSDFVWDEPVEEVEEPPRISYRGSLSGSEGHPGQIMERLSLQAREMADELLVFRSSDPPPPGRLPVSISSRPPEGGIHLKIDLKKLTCVSNVKQRGDIPVKFRTENDRNRGLPIMDLSEESLRGWFDHAYRHFEFFASRLKALLLDNNNGVGEDENLNSKDFDLAFEVFTEEFMSFDEMVSYALTRLRPKASEELRNQRETMSVNFCKLHYACFSGHMCLQEDLLSRVSMDIQKMQAAIIEAYA